MAFFTKLFKKDKDPLEIKVETKVKSSSQKRNPNEVANRKGEIGEYKIDIQLSQLPKEYKYLNNLLLNNPKSISGYSQIDHLIISPYGIFVIETKNYQGTIYGGKDRKTWLINGKFKMLSPLVQNYGHIQGLKKYVDEKFHSTIVSIISFTKRCTLKIEEDLRKISSNQLVIYDIELSEYLHRKISVIKLQAKEPLISEEEIILIYNSISNANITDEKIRSKHVKLIQNEVMDKEGDKHNSSNCVICNKTVSEKVKYFCLSNKKFKGQIYCFEHQKSL